MARKRKGYDDDDGRTVADMSGVFPQRMWMPGRPPGPGTDRGAQKTGRQEDGEEITGRERRWYVLGALKAALLIAAVFLVAFGLLIALLIAVWR
ncbi:MAG TPA: hypothetical protein IAC21_06405 [Candidatus Enterenecus merdae]|nr:hypothetical protein [Candidatus Enterenecus merdae]